jgi:peptidoglycan hydrolase-like protein with peptidoglycan-binding domain
MKYFASALAIVGMGSLSLAAMPVFAAPPPLPGTASLPVYKAQSPRVMPIKRPMINAALVNGSDQSDDNDKSDSRPSQSVRHEASKTQSLNQAEISKIQRALRKRGYYLQVNGTWDKPTVANIKSLQYKHGLKVTGDPDQATLKLLGLTNDSSASVHNSAESSIATDEQAANTNRGEQERVGKEKSHSEKAATKAELTPEQVKRLQQKLNRHGYGVEQSGKWNNQTRSAIIRLQKQRGLERTGYPDRATRRALSITDAMWKSWGNHPG